MGYKGNTKKAMISFNVDVKRPNYISTGLSIKAISLMSAKIKIEKIFGLLCGNFSSQYNEESKTAVIYFKDLDLRLTIYNPEDDDVDLDDEVVSSKSEEQQPNNKKQLGDMGALAALLAKLGGSQQD